MKTRIVQIVVKLAGYVGVPVTAAQSEWLISTVAGLALFVADLWLHRKQSK